jgi:hypothetical protein
MEFDEMNKQAWEIAVLSMMRKGRDVSAYSTTQMRKFFALAQMKDAEIPQKMEEAIRSYTPQPIHTQSGIPDMREQRSLDDQRKRNAMIGGKVSEAFVSMDANMRTRFVQYLMWDTKIIEQAFSLHHPDPVPWIKKVLNAEKVENGELILRSLDPLINRQQNDQRGGGPGSINIREGRRGR